MNTNDNCYIGLGRRKEATARVRLKAGSGKSQIESKNNQNRELQEYFSMESSLCQNIHHPLQLFNKEKNYDLLIRVKGGGFHSQSQAIQLAVARALIKVSPESKATLQNFNLLEQDNRRVERKHTGKKKARKETQFSKR